MGEKSCQGEVKLKKTVGGSQEKTCPMGVKNSFVSEGGKQNTRFCPGVEHFQFCPRGSRRICSSLLFFNGIALRTSIYGTLVLTLL